MMSANSRAFIFVFFPWLGALSAFAYIITWRIIVNNHIEPKIARLRILQLTEFDKITFMTILLFSGASLSKPFENVRAGYLIRIISLIFFLSMGISFFAATWNSIYDPSSHIFDVGICVSFIPISLAFIRSIRAYRRVCISHKS